MKRILPYLFLFFVIPLSSQKSKTETPFVRIDHGHFAVGRKPYYYVGANFWYGPILASKGVGGNRKRLRAELDSMKSLGINNLRILAGAHGINEHTLGFAPVLQLAPRVYNDTILDGLDYLLAEMGKRKMFAVLFLNNSWEFSGGYSLYLQWAGKGKAPLPSVDGFDKYQTFVKQYAKCDSAKELFAQHVKFMLSRTNRYTHEAYKNDPTIMAWQIGNEPRAFGNENKTAYALWIKEVACEIKRIDPNHLLSTGTEGYQGTEGDIDLWQLIHSFNEIDYATIHIWPLNWGWTSKNKLVDSLRTTEEHTAAYITEHLAIARKLDKPLVIEEFGYPRDNFLFAKGSPTTCRNDYYKFIFDQLLESKRTHNFLMGCNFWAWGGLGNPSKNHQYWKLGDDYVGDPPGEQQGLNSVFWVDKKTTHLITNTNQELK